ncbi:High-affinity branched-chain amino acid transport ATP-binding protein LivF [Sporomusa ovata DSM 2662]|uniref:Branched-chain amino acid transport ATP-binding protein LivF (TC 3.A.1.4.1) n=1 Tax=Sporomusa ovata TaxID=2378 RepID=A0A0U1KXU6_9FIRM|nr:high-affinity branched-chain amino acid transport ATP-binding protein LivF [Sporomusa ovata DSM 2662]CQR72251.1 Branched-chain amino acid transport ATP-binding protein LivF (TC 3.A.1.4.1) [Sporomusa ovata]
MALLEIKNLQVKYGVIPALKGISFSVEHGEVVAIIGANGAGKTTTLHAISSIVSKSGGNVFFQEQDITNNPAHEIVAMGISQVQEGRGVFSNLSVLENLQLGAYLRKDKAEIARDFTFIYELFPRLAERQKQLAGTLSGGEQQMLAIGRALMSRPKLLLLDEPSMGLSPLITENIFRTIKKLNKENKMTILLVEQNAQMALWASNRTYIMETGQIVYNGNSKAMKNDDFIRKSYLGQ